MTRALAVAAPAPATNHLWHLVTTLVFMVVALGGIAIYEAIGRRRTSAGDRARRRSHALQAPKAGTRSSLAWAVLALSAAGAGAVHVTVIPEHFREAAIYGAFFTATATAQFTYALALYRWRSRTLLAAGVAGNISLVALWLFSRLVAVPLGPGAGETESFGTLDVLASTFELAFVAAALLLWSEARARRTPSADDPVRSRLRGQLLEGS